MGLKSMHQQSPGILFSTLQQLDEVMIASLCKSAMRQQSMLADQDLFNFGQKGTHMYYIVAGEAEYYHGKNDDLVKLEMDATAHVGERESICEQVLMIRWQHHGLLAAKTPCEVACLDAAKYRDIAKRYPSCQRFCKMFASFYADDLLKRLGSSKELTDLSLDEDSMNDLLMRARSCTQSQRFSRIHDDEHEHVHWRMPSMPITPDRAWDVANSMLRATSPR